MRVALLHDITRAVCQAGHHRVAALWQRLLGPAFAALGHALQCPDAFAADRPEAVARLMQRATLAETPADWARLYSDRALLPEVMALLDGLDADAVLGWELAPNLVRALLARGIPVIDMSLAPLRFAPDLFLRLRTSEPAWAQALAGMAVPADTLALAARTVREAVAVPPVRAEHVLFVGQTDLDASLIEGSRLASAAKHRDALERLLAGRALLLKPHPHGERHADIRLLHRHFPQARLVHDSIYALLSDPALATVATLSSSVAQEAAWFGRPAMTLIRPDSDAVPELSPFHLQHAHVTIPVFWANVLHGTMAPLPHAPSLSLRRTFSLSWGWPPAPPRLLPALGAGWHGFGRGQPGAALPGFGWAPPVAVAVQTALPLATLAFRASGPGAVEFTCRAVDSTGPLPVALGLRPGSASLSVTLQPGQPATLRLPLDPAVGNLELVLQLPEGAEGRIEAIALRLVD